MLNLFEWRQAPTENPDRFRGALVFTHRPVSNDNPIGHCEYRIAIFRPTNDLDPESWTWTDPMSGLKIDDVTHWMPLPSPP